MTERKKILVIGDLMLDEYIVGDDYKMSDEAPVPVLRVGGFIPHLGGAANVAHNIKSMGGDVLLCGAIGEPSQCASAKRFMDLIRKCNIDDLLIVGGQMKTTTKHRVIINDQQVVRFDYEDREVPDDIKGKILSKLDCLDFNRLDLVVVSDYRKGMIDQDIMDIIYKSGVRVIADTKPAHLDMFNNIFCITPNLHEFNEMGGYNFSYYDQGGVMDAGKEFAHVHGIEYVVITMGKTGSVCCSDKEGVFFEAEKVEVPNHIGAGDTFVSAICCFLNRGYDMFESVSIANKAAAVSVSKKYTSICNIDEIKMPEMMRV